MRITESLCCTSETNSIVSQLKSVFEKVLFIEHFLSQGILQILLNTTPPFPTTLYGKHFYPCFTIGKKEGLLMDLQVVSRVPEHVSEVHALPLSAFLWCFLKKFSHVADTNPYPRKPQMQLFGRSWLPYFMKSFFFTLIEG